MPHQKGWSQHVIWGIHRLSGGYLNPLANAWANNIVWGTAKTLVTDGDNIVGGTVCASGDNIVWGTSVNLVWGTSVIGDNIVWGTNALGDNIVWGTDCAGADCDGTGWGHAASD